MVVALSAFWLMPDVSPFCYKSDLSLITLVQYPETAKFLSPSEKEHLLECLKRDTALEPSHFEMRFVWETLRNPMSWLQALIYIGYASICLLCNVPSNTVSAEWLCLYTPCLSSYQPLSMPWDILLPMPNCNYLYSAARY